MTLEDLKDLIRITEDEFVTAIKALKKEIKKGRKHPDEKFIAARKRSFDLCTKLARYNNCYEYCLQYNLQPLIAFLTMESEFR